jgi:large subunit ribosomal protein L25
MGQTYELSATVREKVGKGAARSLRRQGIVPAVIYGGNKPPIAINLPHRDITAKIHGGGFYTTVATIDVGGDKVRVLPRDFQIDPMTERPMHVDFMRVQPGSTVTIEVPVQFINESQAPGIRRGGVLNIVRHRISVIAPVDKIPEKIVADLTGLPRSRCRKAFARPSRTVTSRWRPSPPRPR